MFGLRLASGLDESLQHLKANEHKRHQGDKLSSGHIFSHLYSITVILHKSVYDNLRKHIKALKIKQVDPDLLGLAYKIW